MNVKEGDHVKITLEGVVKRTGVGIIGRRYWVSLTNGGLLECDSLEDISIERVKPPLPIAIGTILRTIHNPDPHIVKFRHDEWKAFNGLSYPEHYIQKSWDAGEYEVFEVKEDNNES